MKRHLFWFLELLIWLLILSLVSNAIMFFKYNYKKNFNTYQIFMPDVDGLIVGSPVKILGIQIGYVNQLDIVGEDVYVKFIVTEKDIKIPRGTKATVEFSGLGGSKSLELYAPTPHEKNTSNMFIIVQNPKRIHDSLGLLNSMFKQLMDVTYSISHFMNQIGMIKEKESIYNQIEGQKSANKFLNFTNDWIEKAQIQCDNFKKKYSKEGKNGKSNGKNKSN